MNLMRVLYQQVLSEIAVPRSWYPSLRTDTTWVAEMMYCQLCDVRWSIHSFTICVLHKIGMSLSF